MSYLPIPPRVWSRVQNECSVSTDTSNLVYDPLTKQYLPLEEYNKLKQIQIKGNILQYKNNSSNITKKQKYTQIAKGLWTNRTKTWATQSLTYTNPNTMSLQRVNTSTLAATANTPFVTNTYSIPPNPFGCPIDVSGGIVDGGNLVGTVTVNPCTGSVIKETSTSICNLSTDCDVPGTPIALCWNPRLPTYYPRQNLTNNNSTDKWPIGYKGLVSALRPYAPVLSGYQNCNSIILEWETNNLQCIPISSYNIYENNIFLKSLSKNYNSTTITNLNYNSSYSFYITALSSNIESEPSNKLTFYLNPFNIILVGTVVNTNITQVNLNWTSSNNACVDTWYLYQNNILYNTYPKNTLSDTISGLIAGNTYIFYIEYSSGTYTSSPSNTVTVNPMITTITNTTYGSYNYTIPINSYYYTVFVIGAGGGGGGGAATNDNNWEQGCLGGSGGGGGGISMQNINVMITSQTQFTYTVGKGGDGGNYSVGQPGGATTFTDGLSIILTANGGSGGNYNGTIINLGNTTTINLGGNGGNASGGSINGIGGFGGDTGGIGTPTNNDTGFSPSAQTGQPSTISDGPGGGGAGGCLYRTNGIGGVYFYSSGTNGGIGGNGAIGGAASLNADGGPGVTLGFGGSGGGGVGGNIFSNSINTGTGGHGTYGSGGGGGGATHNSNNPGNGGNGGDGVVSFTLYGITII